jgi:D-lactate dehydrogenase (cytochrome)
MREPPSIDTAIAELARLAPGRVERGDAVRRQHANTLTWIKSEPPDCVVWPLTADEVSAIVRIAAEHRIPVIPFGAGTSLEGHVNAPAGGISIDMSRMDRVIAVSAADLDCRVEAGITLRALNHHLRDSGLFFAVDPGAEEATLGGMAATRASGTTTVRYGTMRDNVLSLTAVMADGTIISTGGRARKSAAGFDLAHLLVGSEGTLGVITDLTLRLYPVPGAISAAVCSFPSIAAACMATMRAVAAGLGLARIELLDPLALRAVNAHARLALAETPTLFLEFHGSVATVREMAETMGEIAAEEGAGKFEWAETPEARRRLWRARHDAFWAIREAWPGRATMVTDVCVPVSRLAECIVETVDDIARSGLTAPIVGHVGDGNFHAIPVFDADDRAQRSVIEGFLERLAGRALAMEGTCTGEHGIGHGKLLYLEQELGTGVEVMRRIKRALDPDGILNPGKMFNY